MNVYRLAYQINFFQDISFYEVENTESDQDKSRTILPSLKVSVIEHSKFILNEYVGRSSEKIPHHFNDGA